MWKADKGSRVRTPSAVVAVGRAAENSASGGRRLEVAVGAARCCTRAWPTPPPVLVLSPRGRAFQGSRCSSESSETQSQFNQVIVR